MKMSEWKFELNREIELSRLIKEHKYEDVIKIINECEQAIKDDNKDNYELCCDIYRYFEYLRRIIDVASREPFNVNSPYDYDYIHMRAYNLREYYIKLSQYNIHKHRNFIDYLNIYPYNRNNL